MESRLILIGLHYQPGSAKNDLQMINLCLLAANAKLIVQYIALKGKQLLIKNELINQLPLQMFKLSNK